MIDILLAFFDHLGIEDSFTILWNLNILTDIVAVDALGFIAVTVIITRKGESHKYTCLSF